MSNKVTESTISYVPYQCDHTILSQIELLDRCQLPRFYFLNLEDFLLFEESSK